MKQKLIALLLIAIMAISVSVIGLTTATTPSGSSLSTQTTTTPVVTGGLQIVTNLSISAPSSVMPTKSFNMVGWLTDNAKKGLINQTVILQHSIDGKTWTNVSSTKTLSGAAAGMYSFWRSEATEGLHYYRVTWAGTTLYARSTSIAVKVHVVRVVTRLTATTSPGFFNVNETFNVTGSLKAVYFYPATYVKNLTNQNVTLYKYKPTTGAFTPLKTVKTDKNGNFVCPVKETKQDYYWYIGAFAGVPNQYVATLSVQPVPVTVGYDLIQGW